MTTPQNPGRRRRQKVRRTKQLTEWRAKHSEPKDKGPAAPAASAKKTAAAK
jgi:hypothetical protein